MILVLDGYNVIHAIPQFRLKLDQSLQAAREALIQACVHYKSRRGDIERMMIVFDGKENAGRFSTSSQGGVQVLFSADHEEADDRILSLIKNSRKKSFVIVSNDNYVFNHSRALCARVLSVEEFRAMLEKKTPGARPVASAAPRVSAHLADQITAEYKKLLGI